MAKSLIVFAPKVQLAISGMRNSLSNSPKALLSNQYPYAEYAFRSFLEARKMLTVLLMLLVRDGSCRRLLLSFTILQTYRLFKNEARTYTLFIKMLQTYKVEQMKKQTYKLTQLKGQKTGVYPL